MVPVLSEYVVEVVGVLFTFTSSDTSVSMSKPSTYPPNNREFCMIMQLLAIIGTLSNSLFTSFMGTRG